MKYISYINRFRSDLDAAHYRALQDLARIARRNPGAPSDTRAELTGRLKGRVGSPSEYATAQEKGAFIRPRPGRRGRRGRPPAIRLSNGGFVAYARIRVKRWLEKSTRQWPGVLRARIREVR